MVEMDWAAWSKPPYDDVALMLRFHFALKTLILKRVADLRCIGRCISNGIQNMQQRCEVAIAGGDLAGVFEHQRQVFQIA